MNWKEISENCPKAFLEWVSSKVGRYVDSVKYCEEKEFYQKDDEHCFELPNCDFLWVSNDDAVCFPLAFPIIYFQKTRRTDLHQLLPLWKTMT